LGAGEVYDPSQDPASHLHDPAQLAKTLIGPSPSEVQAPANFPHAGLYKLWAQFQRDGRVINVPFVLNVLEAAPKTSSTQAAKTAVAADAIRINVTANGYMPSQISVERGRPVKLLFYRADGQNCASTVVFPQLNITRELPVNEEVVVEFTPDGAGEFSFTCGMGMYKGLLVVQ
jgi:plastocyanin